MSNEMTTTGEPLRFVIEESAATLERCLAHPKVGPQMGLILQEVGTISAAVSKLAQAIDTGEVPDPESASADTPTDRSAVQAELRHILRFGEALRTGQLCQSCGGYRPRS